MVPVAYQRVVNRYVVGRNIFSLRPVFQHFDQRYARPRQLCLAISSIECLRFFWTPTVLHAHFPVSHERVLISHAPVREAAELIVDRKFRIGGDKSVELGDGLVITVQIAQNGRVVRVNLGRSRIERQSLLILTQCLV